MRRVPASTAAMIVLAIGWIVFLVVYSGVPLPTQGWAKPKPGIVTALAAFDHLDYATARRDFTKLAASGNATAETWLAYMDEHGFGAARNPPAAIALYSKAADAGSALAARRLGEMYLSGDGVLQDVTAARPWLERAATAGDRGAARDLGELYAKGLGVAKDPAEAYAWLDIAASRGDALAARERDAVLETLSPAAADRAETLAQATLQRVAHAAPGPERNPAA